MADPKVDPDPQAGAGADPQAGTTGAGAQAKSQADEPISLEKAKELRAEAKNLRERLKALEDEKAQRDADAKRAADAKAKEEGRLGELVAERDRELEALKPQAALAAKLTATFNEQIAAESKDWPQEVKDMLPGEDSLEARLDVLPKLRALAAKLTTGTAHPPGTGRKPEPRGATPAEAADGARAVVASKRVYSL